MSEGASGAPAHEAHERPLAWWERALSVAVGVFVAGIVFGLAAAVVLMLWRTFKAAAVPAELEAAALLMIGACTALLLVRHRRSGRARSRPTNEAPQETEEEIDPAEVPQGPGEDLDCALTDLVAHLSRPPPHAEEDDALSEPGREASVRSPESHTS